ncbi:MAG: HDIG domain-containing protein [Clostridiales bacterium]|nr:HDIG domain-containing protein [Clostridiales bacterium]
MRNRQGKFRYFFKQVHRFFTSSNTKVGLIVLFAVILISGMICLAITPERHDLRVGQIAPKTITATKEVEDIVTTEKNRESAVKNVEPSYHQIEGVKEAVMENFEGIFINLRMVQAYGESLLQKKEEGDKGFTPQEIEYANEMVPEVSFTDSQITSLLMTSKEKLDIAYNETRIALESAYTGGAIRDKKETEAIQNLQRLIGVKVDTGILLYVITPVLRTVVLPNFVIDEDSTQQLKQTAMDAVDPVIYTQGQNIVVAGERVEKNQLEMLRSLGLLSDRKINVANYIGAVLLTVMSVVIGLILLRLLLPSTLGNIKKMSVFMLVLVVTVGITIVFMNLNKSIIPIYMGALLLTSLLGNRAGIIGNIVLSFLISLIIAGGNASYSSEVIKALLTSLTGGTIAVFVLRSKPQRVRVLLCGLCAALSDLIMVFAIGLMINNDIRIVVQNGLYYATGGIVGAILALALQPIFELVFNLATPSKLLELANPKQPLLRRLLLEAPGTYYHSIVVANLAEAAADAIGANGVLARAGAYFHDVGKLKRPAYFKENQHGSNPHDQMDPYMSAAIIMAHTRDGFALTKQHRLPEEIQEITLEHHGDTLIGYFYHKATKQMKEETIDENEFRYGGPRPRSKESAIIMLADTVEAAVRSMSDPNAERIRKFILELVRGKIADGQLSDSPLTLRDIDIICDSFIKVLAGVYHERVEYPTDIHVKKENHSIEKKLQSAQDEIITSLEAAKKMDSLPPVTMENDDERIVAQQDQEAKESNEMKDAFSSAERTEEEKGTRKNPSEKKDENALE